MAHTSNPMMRSKSPSNRFRGYSFYVDFADGMGRDQVSGTPMQTTLSAGRVKPDGKVLGANDPCIQDGKLNTLGQIAQKVPHSENTAMWTGSGPWAQAISIAATGTYTLSTDLAGATVTVTAGSATIDAPASATFGVPDQFVVSVVGTITISTITVNPKAQITPTGYKLPYVKNITAGAITIPHGYSNSTEGYKWPIASCPKLLTALQGTAGNNAQGTINVEWVPQQDYTALVEGSPNLLTFSSNSNPLYFRRIPGTLNQMRFSDNATSPATTLLFVKDVKYTLLGKYGPHPDYANALKYQLTVTDGTTIWEAPLTTFDGSFNPADFLSIGYDNPYWQQIKSIKITEANPWI